MKTCMELYKVQINVLVHIFLKNMWNDAELIEI